MRGQSSSRRSRHDRLTAELKLSCVLYHLSDLLTPSHGYFWGATAPAECLLQRRLLAASWGGKAMALL